MILRGGTEVRLKGAQAAVSVAQTISAGGIDFIQGIGGGLGLGGGALGDGARPGQGFVGGVSATGLAFESGDLGPAGGEIGLGLFELGLGAVEAVFGGPGEARPEVGPPAHQREQDEDEQGPAADPDGETTGHERGPAVAVRRSEKTPPHRQTPPHRHTGRR